ncbi:PDE12 [Bugula neritina]|uniref:PDE12 n=1 Tax=Bugula neritina TaxID=10212 RepID=A0A7J7KKX2_BUGNE|nr:PDE12 [Bugula neritina]
MATLHDMSDKQTVWIRHAEDDIRLQATFTYWKYLTPDDKTTISKQRLFTLNRLIDEPVGETFKRLKVNVAKHFYCQTKGGPRSRKTVEEINTDAANHVTVRLFDNTGLEINSSIPNSNAWVQGGKLEINEHHYYIEINPPAVKELEMPVNMLSGYFVRPKLSLEFADLNDCVFSWYRINGSSSEGILVGEEEVYTPTISDVGCQLKLVVLPKLKHRCGQSVEAVSKAYVTEGPKRDYLSERKQHISGWTSSQGFRVVTYNVLADVYTESEVSRTKLFSHCPASFIDYGYRKLLIAQELLEYKADIICLQELDKKHYDNYYQPVLSRYGYESSILLKKHQKVPPNVVAEDEESDCSGNKDTESENSDEQFVTVKEGSAIFFNKAKFREIGRHNLSIAESIDSDVLFADIMKQARTSNSITEKLLYHSGSSLQVTVLESVDDPTHRLCLCTIHLYFHPMAEAVRLIQTAVSLRHIQRIKGLYESQNHKVSTVFCGDFNSSPDRQTVQLILNRFIDQSDKVFSQDDVYKMFGLELRHTLQFSSASGFPQFTNYVPAFKECIDYIFYETEHICVEFVVPMPSEAQLGGGLPNENFPSDHIPLICDFSWK